MQRFYTFCIRFLQTQALILFGILAAASFLGTAIIEEPYQYILRLVFDNPLLNLLFLCCFLFLFYGIWALFSRFKHGSLLLLMLTCIWVFCVSLLWIYFSKNGPIADGASVYYAAKQFAVNDFSAVSYRDSYFSVYPFQYGLAFFYEMVFRLVRGNNFHILQGINSVCLVISTVSLYCLCGLFFRDKKAQAYTLLFTASCVPLIMYTSFIYGEIPSITFSLFGTWMLLTFLEHPAPGTLPPLCRIFCGTLALLSFSFSVLVRKNSLVFLVALGITSALWLLHNKSRFSGKKLLLYIFYFMLLFSMAISVLPMVQARYAKLAGEKINPGIPASTYLAMGLTESELGPGFYTGYNFETFTKEADYDTETAAKLGWESYKERLSYFMSTPGYSLQFFGRKFCAEWIDTGWAVFPATYNSYGDRPPLAESLFSGALHIPFRSYVNNHQMILYVSAAVCAFSLFHRKKDIDVFVYLFPLTAFGGALLFLAWEASGRYILPYAVFMLPYAGYGASRLLSLHNFKKTDL